MKKILFILLLLFPSMAFGQAANQVHCAFTQTNCYLDSDQFSVSIGRANVPLTLGNFLTSIDTGTVSSLTTPNVYAGQAIAGGNPWLLTYNPSLQYNLSPIVSASPAAGLGTAAIFAARTTDLNADVNSFPVVTTFCVEDKLTGARPTWCNYEESDLVGSPGYHLSEERSIYSTWTPVAKDPYTMNPLGGTANTRLDCGKGSGSPQQCSDALEIINNGAAYKSAGIIVGNGSIAASNGSLSTFAMMPPNYALTWYYAAGTPGWSIFSSETSGGGLQHSLNLTGSTAIFSTDLSASGHLYGGDPVPGLSGCGSGGALTAVSSSTQGTVTEGATTSSCTIVFNKSFSITPTCVVSSPNATPFTSYVAGTGSLVINNASASGNVYSYICMGH